jgi:hypothetical protein
MKCKFRYQNRLKNVYVQNQKYEEIERDWRKLSPKFYREERESRERKKLRDVRWGLYSESFSANGRWWFSYHSINFFWFFFSCLIWILFFLRQENIFSNHVRTILFLHVYLIIFSHIFFIVFSWVHWHGIIFHCI